MKLFLPLFVVLSVSGTAQFSPPIPISTPAETPNPLMSLLSDLNGDGLIDAVVMSFENVSWYPNNGSGGFGSQQIIHWLTNVRSIHIVDVDGDGDQDVLSMRPDVNMTTFSINLGNGQFAPETNLYTSDVVYEVASGDVDSDGDLDILFGLEDDNEVVVALNDGTGQFEFPAISSTAIRRIGPMLVDVDLDNDLDIVFGNFINNWYEWRANEGNGVFGPTQFIGTVTALTIHSLNWADVNGDAIPDLITSDSNDNINWFENLGTGSFGPAQIAASTNGPYSIKVVDMDRDGHVDLVSTHSTPLLDPVHIRFNDGTGTFGTPLSVDENINGSRYLDTGDIDGDGDMDLLVSCDGGEVVAYRNFMHSPFRMEGRIYHDLNDNGALDPLEPAAPWISASTTPVISTALTDPNGDYVIYAESGQFVLTPVFTNSWWQVSNASPSLTVELTAAQPVVTGLDLGIIATADTSVIELQVHLLNAPCGGETLMQLLLRNNGTRIEQGRVVLQLDPLFGFISADPLPDLVAGDQYEWLFDTLGYEEQRTIQLDLIMPDATFLGDTMNTLLQVLRTDQDDLVTDTFAYAWEQEILCSYDPNDKAVTPRGWGANGVVDIGTSHFDYTIRFQNTGNAPAMDVMLRDMLNAHLQQNIIEVLGYSHEPSRIAIEAGGELVVEFTDIQLPDSASAPLASQGYFSFRLFPEEALPSGTVIGNQAQIYFDLNPPIITNTVVNTLIDCDLHMATITDLGEGLLQTLPAASYQWYFNGEPIPGATGQTYQAVEFGNYSVRTTSAENCLAESVFLYTNTGVERNDQLPFELWPNPTTDVLTIALGKKAQTAQIQLIDATGRAVLEQSSEGASTMIVDVSGLSGGLYVVRLVVEGKIAGYALSVVE